MAIATTIAHHIPGAINTGAVDLRGDDPHVSAPAMASDRRVQYECVRGGASMTIGRGDRPDLAGAIEARR